MRKTIFALLLLTTVCSAFKCNKEDAPVVCSSGPLVLKSLESEYGCSNTPMQMHINLNNSYRLINTQAEFNSLVTGSCLPNIDFNQYTLLIGKQALTGGLQNITYTALNDCNSNTQTVNVQITKNLALNAPNVTYHVLLPKVASTSSVQVNTTVN
jgi:hypothetical protein